MRMFGNALRMWLPKPQAAIVVTGSDYRYRERADVVAIGTNDEQAIQEAINRLGANVNFWTRGLGVVKLLGTFYIDNPNIIQIINSNFILDAEGALLVSRVVGGGNLINVQRPAGSATLGDIHLKLPIISEDIPGQFTGNVIHWQGVGFSYLRAYVLAFHQAVALALESAVAGSYNNENNIFDIRTRQCQVGVDISGDGSTNYNYFQRFSFNTEAGQPIGNTGFRNSGPSNMGEPQFDTVTIWLLENDIGIDLNRLTQCYISRVNMELLHNSAIGIQGHSSNQKLIIGYMQVHRDPGAPNSISISRNGTPKIVILSEPGEALANLMMDRFWQQWRPAGWNSTPINGGTGIVGVNFLDSRTTVAANSGHFHDCAAACLSPGTGSFYATNWDKKLHISFALMRIQTDTECYGRLQLKEVAAEGQLAAKGIGIEVQNFALYGESYGIARGLVNLGVSLVDNDPLGIEIIHYPGWKIEFWVAGVLRGTQATLNNIPSGMSGAAPKWVHSILNGATGGVTARFYSFALKTWQSP